VIAEIAACNAAFQIIKGALENGKEIYDVADAASTFFDNKSVIAKKANKDGGKTELQAFMALEKLKEQEVWLKEWMIYAGRADMHNDWLKYQVQCRQNRERAARIAAKKKADMFALIMTCLLWGTGIVVLLPAVIYIILTIFKIL
jgi:hypothetical protein|tara:strand:+ start:81 stop:515 length:435 start_codon:yes stop_codon:yes gene_type:complete